MNKLKQFDEWLGGLYNGLNHIFYMVAVLSLAAISHNPTVVTITYLVMVAIFYGVEVYQARYWDRWSWRNAFKFWLWQSSKIEDVVRPTLVGFVVVGLIFYIYAWVKT